MNQWQAGQTPTKTVTLEMVEADNRVKTYLKAADDAFARIGYKEHGLRHAKLSAQIAGNVLKYLGYSERDVELGKIAGYLHDIGNAVSREHHHRSAGIMAVKILSDMGMPWQETFKIVTAVSGHEEKEIEPTNPITAAVVLGEKTDVHRTRVRKDPRVSTLDTHDRVNYACQRSFLRVDKEHKTISLELTIDTNIIDLMEYFEIFMERMQHIRMAAKYLGCTLELYMNKSKFL